MRPTKPRQQTGKRRLTAWINEGLYRDVWHERAASDEPVSQIVEAALADYLARRDSNRRAG